MLGTLPRRHEAHFVGTGSPPPSYLQGVRSGATLFLLAASPSWPRSRSPTPCGRTRHGPLPSQTTTSATTTRPEPPTLLDTLRSEAICGFVLYSDQDCRLHSLLLPRMVDDVVRNESGGDIFRCRFARLPGPASSPDARTPRGKLCGSRRRDRLRRPRRPYARRSRAGRAQASDLPGTSGAFPLRIGVTTWRLRADGVPWSDDDLRPRTSRAQYLLGSSTGTRVRAVAASFRGPYRPSLPSADGALVGAEDGTVLTRTGPAPSTRIRAPPHGRAVAFSPDDRWIAWVNGSSTFLVGAPDRRSAGANHPPADPAHATSSGSPLLQGLQSVHQYVDEPGPVHVDADVAVRLLARALPEIDVGAAPARLRADVHLHVAVSRSAGTGR